MRERECELLRHALALNARVEAVFLNGSHVVGTAGPDSDVDVTVLVRAEGDQTLVQWALAEVLVFREVFHEVAYYEHEGTTLACSILTTEAVAGMVAGVFDSLEGLLAYQSALQHKIVEATVIHDPAELLAKYQQRLAAYPEALAAEVVAQATGHLQREYLEDWGFRSRFHYCYLLSDLLEHIGRALYARNRRFYMPPLKRWPRDLPTLQPNLEPELAEMIGAPMEGGYCRQRVALESIVKALRHPGAVGGGEEGGGGIAGGT